MSAVHAGTKFWKIGGVVNEQVSFGVFFCFDT